MLKPDLSRDALKFIKRLPPRQSRLIALAIHALCNDQEPPDSKLLKGKLSMYRRLEVGEYRIIYFVDGDLLKMPVIGKRNDGDVYRRMERKMK